MQALSRRSNLHRCATCNGSQFFEESGQFVCEQCGTQSQIHRVQQLEEEFAGAVDVRQEQTLDRGKKRGARDQLVLRRNFDLHEIWLPHVSQWVVDNVDEATDEFPPKLTELWQSVQNLAKQHVSTATAIPRSV